VLSIGVADQSAAVRLLQDVYGFTMTPVASELAASAATDAKVLVKPVEAECITTGSVQVSGGSEGGEGGGRGSHRERCSQYTWP
jgi:hypothetical protein